MMASIAAIQAVPWTTGRRLVLWGARRVCRKHASFPPKQSMEAQSTNGNPVNTLIEGRKSTVVSRQNSATAECHPGNMLKDLPRMSFLSNALLILAGHSSTTSSIWWPVPTDRSLTIYGAFFHMACFIIVLRRALK
jgi:hypothetical protein